MNSTFRTNIILVLVITSISLLATGKLVAYSPLKSILLVFIANIGIYILTFYPNKNNLGLINSKKFIIFIGIILRLLFISYPLSDDVNRYAWEGKIQNDNINPYIVAPLTMANKFKDDKIFTGINHKNISTCYPPIAILTFRAISSINYSLISFKIFFILVDIATLFILSVLLSLWKVPTSSLILYAWNPIILLFGAGEGHIDVLHLFFIALSILFFEKSKKIKSSLCLAIFGFLFLATAVMTKYLSIILLPFLISRKNIKYSFAFLIPFLAFIPFAHSAMFDGIIKFSTEMAYNSVIPRFLKIFLSNILYKVALLSILTLGIGYIGLFFQKNQMRAMLYTYLWCIICLPTMHTWYIMPIAIFLIAFKERSVFLLFSTLCFSFWILNNQLLTGKWEEFQWVWQAEYIPFFILFFYDHLCCKKDFMKKDFSLAKSIDVIVPVFNEEKNLPLFLKNLQIAIKKVPLNTKITLVDAGSTDDSMKIMKSHNLNILQSKKGRGKQIATGIKNTSADLILTLHVDTLVNENAILKLCKKLSDKPDISWGIMGHNYDKKTLKMSCIKLMNYFRFHILKIAFGDQGIFFKRKILDENGGFPEISLMEDVEISQRLNDYCSASIAGGLTASTRRWQQKTLFSYSLQVLLFVLYYLIKRRLGFPIKATSDKLYSLYY